MIEGPRAAAVAQCVLGGARVPEVVRLVLEYAPAGGGPVAIVSGRGSLHLVHGRPDVYICVQRAFAFVFAVDGGLDLPLACIVEPERRGRDDDGGRFAGGLMESRAMWSGNDAGHFAPHRQPNLLLMRDGTRLILRLETEFNITGRRPVNVLAISIYSADASSGRSLTVQRFRLENMPYTGFHWLATAWVRRAGVEPDTAAFVVCQAGEFEAKWDLAELRRATVSDDRFQLYWDRIGPSHDELKLTEPIPDTDCSVDLYPGKSLGLRSSCWCCFLDDAFRSEELNRLGPPFRRCTGVTVFPKCAGFTVDTNHRRLLVLSRAAGRISALPLPDLALPPLPPEPLCAPACVCRAEPAYAPTPEASSAPPESTVCAPAPPPAPSGPPEPAVCTPAPPPAGAAS